MFASFRLVTLVKRRFNGFPSKADLMLADFRRSHIRKNFRTAGQISDSCLVARRNGCTQPDFVDSRCCGRLSLVAVPPHAFTARHEIAPKLNCGVSLRRTGVMIHSRLLSFL